MVPSAPSALSVEARGYKSQAFWWGVVISCLREGLLPVSGGLSLCLSDALGLVTRGASAAVI